MNCDAEYFTQFDPYSVNLCRTAWICRRYNKIGLILFIVPYDTSQMCRTFIWRYVIIWNRNLLSCSWSDVWTSGQWDCIFSGDFQGGYDEVHGVKVEGVSAGDDVPLGIILWDILIITITTFKAFFRIVTEIQKGGEKCQMSNQNKALP
jgi:hypothetical protein